MDYRDVNKVISFSPTKLNNDEIMELNLPFGIKPMINFITKIDNNYYYYKKVNNKEMINELIGSYLCKLIELDVVDYKIGEFESEMYALSKIFYKKEYLYSYCLKYFGLITDGFSVINAVSEFFKCCQTNILSKIENPTMILDILKLTLIDLKMGQGDRDNYSNLMLKISEKDNTMGIAPIYDFGYSYCKDYCNPGYYINPFVIIRKNKSSLLELSKRYPEIIDIAKILVDIPIVNVLDDISKENGVIFNRDEINYYNNKDKEYTKLLRKML